MNIRKHDNMKINNNKLFSFILAGGEGKRMQNLTKDTCKPMVKVASHFHLIDFTLINCLRSNLFNLAVIVQYESNDLIKYLLETNINSLCNFYILPPKTNLGNIHDIEFKNTAHSVYMNLDIVDDDIEDVLILSADHLYTMDYDDIYEEHKKRGNDLTVAVFNVSPNDVSRFGIFTLDDYGNLISFEEKPEQSDSTLASMGIYIFKREFLDKVLTELIEVVGIDLDFGKHVLPYFLENYNVGVYEFPSYWSDLGTVNAFWDVSMYILDNPDIIRRISDFNAKLKISRDVAKSIPPFFEGKSMVFSSILGENSYIKGEISHSIIGNNVNIEEDAAIRNSVVMDNCIIKKGVLIENAVISQNSIIYEDVISDEEIICK